VSRTYPYDYVVYAGYGGYDPAQGRTVCAKKEFYAIPSIFTQGKIHQTDFLLQFIPWLDTLPHADARITTTIFKVKPDENPYGFKPKNAIYSYDFKREVI
jgi:hypothetical protein